ncbi:MAG: hypothetical protein IBX61_03325 [Thermoleophilia bacterium]|nr:hypothetical protein [Thermoleophilia bacterium]
MNTSSGAAAGTIRSVPLRVGFLNGDWERARIALEDAGIEVMFQSVSSVEPYTATIHVGLESGEKTISALEAAGIAWGRPAPYY